MQLESLLRLNRVIRVIGFGGFNLIDLPELAYRLQKPCVAVMRHYPNFNKIEQAIYH